MNVPMESGPNGNGYVGYVPGPSMATVPYVVNFVNGGDDRERRVSALAGLPQVTPIVTTVAVPGTVGAFAQVVLGVTTRVG